MTLRAAVFGTALILAACAYEPLELRHPETGDYVSCGFSYLGEPSERSRQTAEACARHYEQQGYRRARLAE